MENKEGIIKAIGDFVGTLTPAKIFMGVIAAFFSLCLYSLYENRAVAFIYIWNSSNLLIGLGASLLFVIFGWITSVSVQRVQDLFESRIAEQEKQITILREDLDECKLDCREASSGMLKQILEKLNDRS